MQSKLFRINNLDKYGQEYSYVADIITDHPVFRGHFPQNPVVPGVCTLEMIKDCLEDILQRKVKFQSIRECKFLATILPSEHKQVCVHISLKEDDQNNINVVAEVSYMETKMMKLKASLQ